MTENFEVGKAPHITITTCHGDLIVQGRDVSAIGVKGDDFQADEVENGLTLSSSSRLQLSVPKQSSLAIETAHGDVIVKHLTGHVSALKVSGDAILVAVESAKLGDIHSDLSAKQVSGQVVANTISGDAVLRQIGSVTVDTVHGDLSARMVAGAVTINQVMGDVSLRNIDGDTTIAAGHRDANFRFLGGNTSVGPVSGDIRLYGGLAEGKHVFHAGGDIILRWPTATDLTLTANANRIANRLQLDNVIESEGTLSGTIGNNGPVVTLTANGGVILKDLHVVREEHDPFQGEDVDFDFMVDLEGLGARIMAEVNANVARVNKDLEKRFGPEFTQQIVDRFTRKAERAAERAEKAAEEARRRAERRMRQQKRRRSAPPPPPKKKASAAEQLKILKMVEEGLVSPEEANMLLEALED